MKKIKHNVGFDYNNQRTYITGYSFKNNDYNIRFIVAGIQKKTTIFKGRFGIQTTLPKHLNISCVLYTLQQKNKVK